MLEKRTWLDPTAFDDPQALVKHTSAYRARFDAGDFSRLLVELNVSAASTVGLDFSGLTAGVALGDDRVRRLLSLASHDKASLTMFDADEPPRRQLRQKAMQAEASARQLHHRGYLRVDDWNIPDFHALQHQASAALRSLGKAAVQRVAMPRLDAVHWLLANKALATTIRTYLGGKVRYDGHVLLRLAEGVSLSNYNSARWHHDRCGRRLKLFVFMHDVDVDGRPTIVAPGSHKLWYGLHSTPARITSRFNEAFVREHFSPVPMTGRGGGGFIFDTNALHRGEHIGRRNRTTLILEFHAHGKLAALRGDFPCPSLDPFRARAASRRGRRMGEPMYLRESQKSQKVGATGTHAKQRGAEVSSEVCNGWRVGSLLVRLFPHLAPPPRACVPIEALPKRDWRGGVKLQGVYGASGIEQHVTYKPTQMQESLASFPRRVYVDLGANTYESSVGSWFVARYPHADTFDSIIAFEANPMFNPT